jgi:hypothetical protein
MLVQDVKKCLQRLVENAGQSTTVGEYTLIAGRKTLGKLKARFSRAHHFAQSFCAAVNQIRDVTMAHLLTS